MRDSSGTWNASCAGKSCLFPSLKAIAAKNIRLLRRTVFKPYFRAFFIRLIRWYQRRLSRHTCLYTPTCSEYTKRCINNLGCVLGIALGLWRILRCNPLSKGGYDPAPENYFKVRWVI